VIELKPLANKANRHGASPRGYGVLSAVQHFGERWGLVVERRWRSSLRARVNPWKLHRASRAVTLPAQRGTRSMKRCI